MLHCTSVYCGLLQTDFSAFCLSKYVCIYSFYFGVLVSFSFTKACYDYLLTADCCQCILKYL